MFKFLFFILALLLVSFNAVSVSAHPLSQMRRADWTAVARRAPVDDLIVPKVVREIEAGPLKVRVESADGLRARAVMGKRSWKHRNAA